MPDESLQSTLDGELGKVFIIPLEKEPEERHRDSSKCRQISEFGSVKDDE